ncbi:MAG TPA: hypothetical protein DDZ80_15500 [Cyanobacteria bacterium UBA8803]|nr:hypothetical protein [Cyanobacteria bacterium UBA9273]HBL59823.1 hypothetical protein [Cyanobacteria bacterium UBA8803]
MVCKRELGRTVASLGNFREASELYEQSLNLARELGDRRGEAKALRSLGNVQNILGNPQQAIHYIQQAIDIFGELKDREHQGLSTYCLGNVLRNFGQFQQAIAHFQQYLTIAKKVFDYSEDTTELGASIGTRLGNYQSTIDYHQRSLAIAQENEDRVHEAANLCNLGWNNLLIGNYEQAIDCNQKSLAIAQDIGLAHCE